MRAKVLLLLIFVLVIKTSFAQPNANSNKLYLQFLCSVNEIALKNKKVSESVLTGATIRVVDSDNKQVFFGDYDEKKKSHHKTSIKSKLFCLCFKRRIRSQTFFS